MDMSWMKSGAQNSKYSKCVFVNPLQEVQLVL